MQYRRISAPDGTFFFTLVSYERRQVFGEDQAVTLLRNAFRSVLQKHPFTIEAAVVLPDHLHMIWRLPENDGDYAIRWRLIKNNCWVSLRSTQPTPAMPDRIPLSRARERGRGEGEIRYTSGVTPTDFRYTGQRSENLLGS